MTSWLSLAAPCLLLGGRRLDRFQATGGHCCIVLPDAFGAQLLQHIRFCVLCFIIHLLISSCSCWLKLLHQCNRATCHYKQWVAAAGTSTSTVFPPHKDA
jgi:hypothetical protein